jgi:anti-sigma regulatory factor (Ser/Thr protein kinase)
MSPEHDDVDVRLDLPAELTLLWPLDAFARELLLGVRPRPARKAIDEALLVLHEAFTNVYRHAYEGKPGGRVAVVMHVCGNTIEIQLEDTGKSFNLAEWKEPDIEFPAESGRGVWLMKKLTDRIDYVVSPGGRNTLQLRKQFEPESGD